MKKVFLGILLCLCTLGFANIEGTYQVKGKDPYKKEDYAGKCIIKKDKNDVFQAHWIFDNGAEFSGTGLVMGENASFVFSGSEEKPTKIGQEPEHFVGLQIYTIEGERLKGIWVIEGNSLLGHETMERKSNP